MTKRIITCCASLLLVASGLFAQQNISLDGEWTFWTPQTSKVTVTVPHTFNIMEGLEDYVGQAFYSRELPVTPDMAGKTVRLHFNAVYHDAVVFVNDAKVGEHMDAGYSPFSFDITSYLDFAAGAHNVLKVECSNRYSETAFPYANRYDWNSDGGIIRDVDMHVSGSRTLRYVHVTPDINLADSTASARFDIKLWGLSPKKADFCVKVVEERSGRIVYEGQQSLKLTSDGVYTFSTDCGKVELWHFDNPALYSFDVRVLDKKKVVSDEIGERFGFRTITVEGDHLCLNGEPVRLPGIENMPGSNPEMGMAETHEYMRKTIQRMKDLNCTITRFHWPQDDYRMSVFDEMGILVQEELPWWQGPEGKLTPEQVESAKRQLSEFIEAHYNHPCIFAWGLSNEVRDNRADLPELYAYAKSFDSTRIVDVVCNNIYESLDKDPSLMLDLPTWNEYMGTWHGNSREDFLASIPSVKEVLKGRPILITEHGLCEPAYSGGDSRRVDEMIYHITQWKHQPFICGYIYFSLEDYRTHIGEEGVGRDKVRRHGVCNKYLEPKASYYILQQLMSPVQVTRVSNRGLADYSAFITVQASDDIPSYTVRGYKIDYQSNTGAAKSVDMPALAPGQSFSVTVDDMNKDFKFYITRSDGSIVLKY